MPVEPKVLIAVRVTVGGNEYLDSLAREYLTTKATVVRAAMKVAAAHPSEMVKILQDQL